MKFLDTEINIYKKQGGIMHIKDSKGFEQDKIHKGVDLPTMKWRRIRKERRSEDVDFSKEKRSLKDRRSKWLDYVSGIIFPGHSDM